MFMRMHAYLKKFSLFVICVIFCPLPGAALSDIKPSFDCAGAVTEVEKVICSSESLADLDRMVSSEYKKFINELNPESAEKAIMMQRIWNINRGKGCAGLELEECVKEDYYHWLNAISKGFLVARYRELVSGVMYRSPFSNDVWFEVDHQEDSDGDTQRIAKKLIVNDGAVLHEGGSYSEFGNVYSVDVIDQVVFFLSMYGNQSVALRRVSLDHGGRCEDFYSHSLQFVNPYNPEIDIATIDLYEVDAACDTYEKELFRWGMSERGNPVFYELDYQSFYYQVPFFEIKEIEVDSEDSIANEGYFVDESEDSFMGVPYAKIISHVQNEITGVVGMEITESCQIAGRGLRDYLHLKRILGNYHIGFNQIEFFSVNILSLENIRNAMAYRPLVEAALRYLDKARMLEDWERKIVYSSRQYPQIRATSNYYYDRDVEWEVNPFVISGFYTDKDCYSRIESPWHLASGIWHLASGIWRQRRSGYTFSGRDV